MQSRTGEVCRAMGNHAVQLQYDLREAVERLGGLFVVGEAWWPGKGQFSRISGDFRRHSPSKLLQFILNDVLTAQEFALGKSDVPYGDRMERLAGCDLPVLRSGLWALAEGWNPSTYGDPQTLCNQLADEGGYDGLILRDPEGTWTKGRGTTGEIVKIKRTLSYDLLVLEVNSTSGEKTGRTVYKLVLDFMGKRLGVGSGVPHDQADLPAVGDIVEIEAMDLSSNGLLREPRFKGIRHDKLEPDTL